MEKYPVALSESPVRYDRTSRWALSPVNFKFQCVTVVKLVTVFQLFLDFFV